jgi:hypothetical protein
MTVTAIKPALSSVQAPDELRELPGWLMWRYEHHDGEVKPRKVPYYVNGTKRHGVQGRPEDRQALTTFEAARTAAARRGYDGVGFAPMPEWGIVALDFDNCIKGGDIHPDVEAVVAGTYAEFSPSGNGIRAFMRGHLGNLKAHGEPYGFETFSSKGFVTFTGNRLDLCDVMGTANAISPVDDTTLAAIRRRFKRDEREAATHSEDVTDLSDDQVTAILDALDPDLPHQPWVTVGMALHHQYRGSDEGFDRWDEWSSAGSKYPGRDALRKRWESFGRNPAAKSVTARSLILMGKEAGVYVSATAPATAEEFEAVLADAQAQATVAAKPLRFQFVQAGQFASATALPWIIKGVLPQAGLAVIYGASGSGKSFAVLDMGMAIARGQDWRGRRVKQGRVAYIAAEGADGFRKRLAAYAQHYEAPLDDVPFCVLGAAPNLMEEKDTAHVVLGIKAAGGADVVIVDTFAQTTPGANENAGEDVGKALGHCKRIHEQTGALVVLVHHSGKDATKGARGWSGLRAAADAEIEVVREGDQRMLQLTKNKDGEDGQQWGFKLEVVQLGIDDDLDPITSCVVVEAEVMVKREPGKDYGPNERVVFEVLREFSQVQTSGIEVAAVVAESVRRMPEPEEGKRDTRKQRVRRAIETLCTGDTAPFWLDGQCISVC